MRTPLCSLMALCAMTTMAIGATGSEVEEKYLIPVPSEQKKIKLGETKTFQDGNLTITVTAIERTGIEMEAEGVAMPLPSSVETLVEGANGTICTTVYLGKVGARAIVSAACEAESDDLRAALVAQQSAAPVEVVDPVDLIAEVEQGGLENPYLGDVSAIAEGQELFLANSCNGCHGGTGGGGMGPPLSNGVWVYGIDDDTLFRLVTLGSDGLIEAGYSRVAREKVVGPMPPYEGIIESADDLWKILAWVRSISQSDAPPLK